MKRQSSDAERGKLEFLCAQRSSTTLNYLSRCNPFRAGQVLGVNCGLYIVADEPVSLPLVAIERASGSVSEICLSFALHHLGIDHTKPRDLFVQFQDFVLEPRNLCLRHRISTAV